MIIQPLKDKDGNNLYSSTILHESQLEGKFTTRLLDVRDGDAKRREVRLMERNSNRTKGSKYHK